MQPAAVQGSRKYMWKLAQNGPSKTQKFIYFWLWPVCGRFSGCISGFGPYVEGRRQSRVGGRGQGGGSPDVFPVLARMWKVGGRVGSAAGARAAVLRMYFWIWPVCGRSAVRSMAGARRGIGETSGKS